MKQIKLLLFIMILFSLSFISAFSSNSFNNSLTNENITFTGGINTPTCYQESANVSTSCGGLDTGNYVIQQGISKATVTAGGIWSGCGLSEGSNVNTTFIYVNYTKPSGINKANWNFIRGYETNTSFPIPSTCFNNSNIALRINLGTWVGFNSALVGGDCLNSSGQWQRLTTCAYGSGGGYASSVISNAFDGNNLTAVLWVPSLGGFIKSDGGGSGNTYDDLEFFEEGITWISENITRYLSIPSNTVIINGYLNLSGYINYILTYSDTPNSNLKAYYHLDNQSNYGENSTLVHDFSGSNNGIIYSSIFTNGKYAGGYSFNGVSDKINITNDLIDTGNDSICAWVNVSSYNSININYIFHNGQFTLIARNTTLKLNTFELSNDNVVTQLDALNNVTLGNWQHVCATRNSTGWGWIYVNGILQVNGNAGTPASSTYSMIGNRPVNDRNFNGTIDEVMIFNKTLSSSEVNSIYTTTKPDFTYPTNASLSINSQVWNYLGIFNKTNNKTNNLANYINSYLTSCSYIAGYCYVPFTFHSDTSGILMYSDLIFNNIGFTENSQTYNSNTYETANEQFRINITYDTNYYLVSTANLIYNNTSYTSTKLTSGLNNIFTTNVSIPLVAVDKTNNTFYWVISLTNTTGTFSFNTSLNNQTVNQISLGNCGGTNSSLALNITAYNEKTLDRINPFSIAGTLTYSIGSSTLTKTYSFGNTSLPEKDICINVNTTYTLNGLISYTNDSFQPSTFYFINSQVSNNTNVLALYLLPVASSTSFILQVQDQNILPLAGYTIKINRYYPAFDTYQTVQVVKTDGNGQSISFLETETVDYQFLIYDTNGNLVYTSDRRKIIPQSTPYTITFTVGPLLPSPLIYLENLTGLTYSLTYDKTTMKVTYTYADSNSSFTSSRLIVSALNLSGSNYVLCNSTLTTPSGVIICDLTGNLSGTYSATAYIIRDTTNFIDNIIFEINTFADTSGLLGVMGGFFILLICAFLFPYSPIASIVTLDIGIIFLNIIGFVNFGLVTITAVIGISILILIILERD